MLSWCYIGPIDAEVTFMITYGLSGLGASILGLFDAHNSIAESWAAAFYMN